MSYLHEYMRKESRLLVASGFFVFFIFAYFYAASSHPKSAVGVPEVVSPGQATPLSDMPMMDENAGMDDMEVVRTDFEGIVPTDFPANIPFVQDAQLDQSYSLYCHGETQMTITFLSTKSIKENFDLYKNFFESENWSITNAYESEALSSLYAIKGKDEINVTINGSELDSVSKSRLSISALKK